MRGTVQGINARRWVICEAGMCEAKRTTVATGVVVGCEPLFTEFAEATNASQALIKSNQVKSSQVAFNAVCQAHTVTMKCK